MNSKTARKPAATTLRKLFLGLLFFSLSTPGLLAVQPAVAAGMRHSLFLKSDGTVWACGNSESGQVGNDSFTDQWTPVQVISGVKAIAAGQDHSLFLKDDGTVWACGQNGHWELGDGSRFNRKLPVQVLISDVKAISAGDEFSLFLKNDGTVWACGANDSGKLGDGTTIDKGLPVQAQISNVTHISAGRDHSLFLKTNGTVWACGSNFFQQFGNGTNAYQLAPVQVMSGGAAISASGNGTQAISLIVKTDGTVWGAGSNGYGQLGIGPNANSPTTFVQSLISDVMSVSSYGIHSRFLKADGTAWACGTSSAGSFGNGNTSPVFTPAQVQSGIMQMATGYEHCLYLRKDGFVIAWGANNHGQLGNGLNQGQGFAVPIMSLARMLNVTTTAGGAVTGAGAYEPDATATLTATPALGYLFGGWEGDATGAANPLSIVMDASKNVVANFNRDMSDTDGDGLTLYEEVLTHGTNPDIADTDEDGYKDGFEVSTGYSPTSATSTPDALSSIHTAVEFRFNAAEGVSYRIEASTDLESWETIEAAIIGQSGVVTRFYSIENLPKRYFRVRRN
jgi:alpha-tubulin suppressor-like RCC1 family protein